MLRFMHASLIPLWVCTICYSYAGAWIVREKADQVFTCIEHPGASSGYHSTRDRLLARPLKCQPCASEDELGAPGTSAAAE